MIRALTADDYPGWLPLWRGYLRFYRGEVSDEVTLGTFRRLAGGLDGRSWTHLALAAAVVLPASLLLMVLARPLDVLSLGDEEAASLGLHVTGARLLLLGLTAAIVGAGTAVAGSVPFVGLVAPHALRPLVGPLARHLLPAAFLGGALLVVIADLAARTVNPAFDLPLGSLTALVGAPYFLVALRGLEDRG